MSKSKRDRFVSSAVKKIKSVRDIKSIVIEREYDASGEFADLVADGDRKLVALASNYIGTTGIERERAEAEMITYIHTTTEAQGQFFGGVKGRYRWNDKSVDKLAKRLVSNYGPGGVYGTERIELDLKTGEYFDESDFDLC